MSRRLGALIVTAIVAAFAVAQPRVSPLWSLYVADPAARSGEVLFLEPFPNAGACGAAARALGTTGQWTRCRAHLSLSLARSERRLTLERDFLPGGAWERLEALCGIDSESRVEGSAARKRSQNGLTSRAE
jgi:hypothetical protein